MEGPSEEKWILIGRIREARGYYQRARLLWHLYPKEKASFQRRVSVLVEELQALNRRQPRNPTTVMSQPGEGSETKSEAGPGLAR